jgi:hypothetical protein
MIGFLFDIAERPLMPICLALRWSVVSDRSSQGPAALLGDLLRDDPAAAFAIRAAFLLGFALVARRSFSFLSLTDGPGPLRHHPGTVGGCRMEARSHQAARWGECPIGRAPGVSSRAVTPPYW